MAKINLYSGGLLLAVPVTKLHRELPACLPSPSKVDPLRVRPISSEQSFVMMLAIRFWSSFGGGGVDYGVVWYCCCCIFPSFPATLKIYFSKN